MRLSLFVFLLAAPLALRAQTPLTEAEAVRRGLARTDLADLDRAALLAAEADVMAAGQLQNPTLSFSRERVGGAIDTLEHDLVLAQTFDLSGRRALNREAATRRVAAAGAGNANRRRELSAEIRRTFHEALFRQQVTRATETWAQRFARVESMVAKLARAGEASGYDRRRLERERQSAGARLAAQRADSERILARLAAQTGLASVRALSGELLPPQLPPAEKALSRIDQRPDLLALARRAEAADLETRAAQRGHIPEVTVGVGPKRVDEGNARETGIALSLSVPLPVFDRRQAARQRASAEALQARAEYRLARARARAELQGLQRQTEALRATAIDYRARSTAASAELLRIAEASYQGGESSLLELLDAYRGVLEAETTALELEQRAREGRIEYELLVGGSE